MTVFFEAVEEGKRTLTQLRKLIEQVRKAGNTVPLCLVSVAAGTVSTASFRTTAQTRATQVTLAAET